MIAAARPFGKADAGLFDAVWKAVLLLLVVARGDARRPASWIALVAAASAAAALSGVADAAAVARAIACGGLVAAAAVGSLALPEVPARIAWVWWASRAAWPVVAAIAVALATGSGAAVTLAAAAIVTTLAHAAATRWGAKPVDAIGGALALTAAAAGGASWATDAGTAAGGAGACWLVLAAGVMAISGRHSDPLTSLVSLTSRERGIGGSLLTRLEMASTLAAMVICYFLAAEHRAWYVAISAAWFVVLAVPAATIGPGAVDAGGRGALQRSAGSVPRLPGTLPYALGAVATHAAILGWPAGVAALVRGPSAAEPWGPLVALLVLTSLAAATAVSVWIASRCRMSGDTSLAMVATWLIAVGLA
ncbi:MAG: hypothetical protein K8S94_14545 [Planctomycetia bacterium]|nr:hypothetical protein [Planctomycetia bacterium]